MDAKEFFGDWAQVIDIPALGIALAAFQTAIDQKGTSMMCPKPSLLFRAFSKCKFDTLKVVMVGQSPYPQEGIATGIAFGNKTSTPQDKWSPSLKVLYNSALKFSDDLPFSEYPFIFPSLEGWEEQGVLLYNAALSCEVGKPDSHQLIWRTFSKNFLTKLANTKKDVIFVLFGENAKDVGAMLPEDRVIKCVHPSYCARTGTSLPDVFTQINEKLISLNKQPICWI